MMATIFECWFPEAGETLRDSGAYLADDPTEAAEKAAAERNWKSTDFIDRCVAVSTIIGDEPKLFDVTVESRPEYTARQRA